MFSKNRLSCAGVQPNEGVGISRTPDASLNPAFLADGAIVQVNNDHWEAAPLLDIMNGRARLSTAKRLLHSASEASLAARWAVLSTSPIKNDQTVYAALMSASEGYFSSGVARLLPINGDVPTEYVDAALLPSNYFA